MHFAPQTVGVENAAGLMFGKSAESLSAHEAALLVTAHRRPYERIPWCDRQQALSEARVILERMAEAGLITHDALERQLANPPDILPLPPRLGLCGIFC